MPAKKKGDAQKKDQEENFTEKLYKAYRRKLAELEISMPKSMEEKFLELRDEKEPGDLTEVIMWENVGSPGARALADALRETEYKLLRSMRFWKANIEDEGVRALCQFLQTNMTVNSLELMECSISPLGCEFLGGLLGPAYRSPITVLKLDHNEFGDAGMIKLAQGLAENTVLQELSLTYCGIGPEGAEGLFEILIYVNCGLTTLDLQGNMLMNDGVCRVLHALKVNKSLVSLCLVDNQFGEDPKVTTKLAEVFHNNDTLLKLDLLHNGIYDDGARFIRNALDEVDDTGARKNCTLGVLRLPEKVSMELNDEIQEIIAKNKGKKKKGGKKGKKGKKKK